MKAKIVITPKKILPDPQSVAVQEALSRLGYGGIHSVQAGRYVEIDLVPGTDPNSARQTLEDAGQKLLCNPVLEDLQLEITD